MDNSYFQEINHDYSIRISDCCNGTLALQGHGPPGPLPAIASGCDNQIMMIIN